MKSFYKETDGVLTPEGADMVALVRATMSILVNASKERELSLRELSQIIAQEANSASAYEILMMRG